MDYEYKKRLIRPKGYFSKWTFLIEITTTFLSEMHHEQKTLSLLPLEEHAVIKKKKFVCK